MSAARHDGRIRVLTLGRDVGRCFGGAEGVAYEFVKRLSPERFKRYLCVTHARPPERRELNEQELRALEEGGVRVLRLERDTTRATGPWLRLYSLLRSQSIEILHSHMPRASVPGAIVGKLAGVPAIVSHEHGWSYEGKPVRRLLDRQVLARCSDAMVAVSEWDRRQMIEVEGIPGGLIHVLHNGIPPMPPETSDVRGELGIAPGAFLIGAVGRLYPEKGYDELIAAVALLKAEGRQLVCVILGHGPEQPRLEERIRALGLQDEVRLLGRRGDVAGVVRALDVAVLPSRHEGSPLAVMEYMACGAPIVASAVGGVPELIADGVHGLLTPPHDPPALAAAIGRLLGDRQLAARLGRAALDRQRESYDLDTTVGRLEELYLELHRSKSGIVPRTTERHA